MLYKFAPVNSDAKLFVPVEAVGSTDAELKALQCGELPSTRTLILISKLAVLSAYLEDVEVAGHG